LPAVTERPLSTRQLNRALLAHARRTQLLPERLARFHQE
jgi:hypothetical protein